MKFFYLLIVLTFFSCGKHSFIQGGSGAGNVGNSSTINSNALIVATTQGNYAEVKKFISEGTDPNITNDQGNSLLMIAAKSNNYVIVDLLVKSGADIEFKNEAGETAFELAGSDFTKKLIDSNDAVTNDDWESYLLQIVKEANQKNEAEKILEIALLFEFGVSPNTADTRASVLMYACSKGLIKTVEFLVNNDDLEINMVMGRSPRLYTALDRTRDKVIKAFLIDHGAMLARDL